MANSNNKPTKFLLISGFCFYIILKLNFFREPVSTSAESLDPRHVFLVDGGLNIFVWYGRKCKNLLKSKARLMSEKINKIERKDKVKFLSSLIYFLTSSIFLVSSI